MLVQSKEIERDEDRTNRGDIGNSENRGKRRLMGLRWIFVCLRVIC